MNCKFCCRYPQHVGNATSAGNAALYKHGNFEETFPQNSEVRTTKLNALKSSYQAASRILVTSLTQQQKATECSFRVVWILGQHKKPFSDAEIIKE